MTCIHRLHVSHNTPTCLPPKPCMEPLFFISPGYCSSPKRNKRQSLCKTWGVELNKVYYERWKNGEFNLLWLFSFTFAQEEIENALWLIPETIAGHIWPLVPFSFLKWWLAPESNNHLEIHSDNKGLYTSFKVKLKDFQGPTLLQIPNKLWKYCDNNRLFFLKGNHFFVKIRLWVFIHPSA